MTPNAEQLAAIYGRNGAPQAKLNVVIAGPGSGKTFTLVEAVKVESPVNVVVVMTFTNGAAHELAHRIGPDYQLAYIGTTHGYCLKLIQRFGEHIGYRTGEVVILPKEEQLPRLLAVRDKFGIKMSAQNLTLTNPPANPAIAANRALILREYGFLLKSSNLVDFDLILSEGAALLQVPEVRLASKIDLLVVDERQDSNVAEQKVYDLVPAERRKFFVGDPDQSIYEWRGADPRGLVELTKAEGAEVFTLELNYRSDVAICEAANKLIGHNEERYHKLTRPVSKEPGGVLVHRFANVFDELAFIACKIRELWRIHATGAFKTDEPSIAILYRTNFEVKRCSAYMVTASMPVSAPFLSEGRMPDWDRAVLILSLAASPDNEILAERYLKLDHQSKVVQRWALEAQAGGDPLSAKIPPFVNTASIGQLLARGGVNKGTAKAIQRRAELLPSDASLSDLIQDLYQHDQLEEQTEEAKIHVGTMHSAKGREWDVVFLPAFEQGIIPEHGSTPRPSNSDRCGMDEDEKPRLAARKLEEDRRLAFVALTRARHIVYISSVEFRRHKWGAEMPAEPSQFIKEMGL